MLLACLLFNLKEYKSSLNAFIIIGIEFSATFSSLKGNLTESIEVEVQKDRIKDEDPKNST